ncbi:helix-turn-helix domain-containing protein [Brevibacillus massiliensis]|uniref:helix-turn-helix domain-containing protein n=1 Tax=Brevibacillus massiliensis TaxID=1118054 RepID=UPI0002DF3A59|nr:helix-turn-helix transcriptional regulator [Brevibacillus massiliensis]
MNEFGRYIKQIRESKNLTLTYVAEQIGIDHSHLSRIENGERNAPKAPTIRKLAKVLGVSFLELMEKAGHWEKLDEEEKRQLAEIYANEDVVETKILRLLRGLANDEGKFPGNLHKDIFAIFGGYLPLGSATNKFDHWYLYDYLNADPDDLSESDAEYAYEEFNKNYNFITIKKGIQNLDDLILSKKSLEEFLAELESLYKKQNLKNPFSDESEKEFLAEIDLSDEELMQRYKVMVDGRELTEKEWKKLLAFLRMERDLD